MKGKEVFLSIAVVTVAVILVTLLNPWTNVDPNSPRLGPSIAVSGDHSLAAETPRHMWTTWVILENPNPEPVQIAFQTKEDTEYHRDTIKPKERVALRIGPEDIQFRFYFSGQDVIRAQGEPPKLVDRVNEEGLREKYWGIQRF